MLCRADEIKATHFDLLQYPTGHTLRSLSRNIATSMPNVKISPAMRPLHFQIITASQKLQKYFLKCVPLEKPEKIISLNYVQFKIRKDKKTELKCDPRGQFLTQAQFEPKRLSHNGTSRTNQQTQYKKTHPIQTGRSKLSRRALSVGHTYAITRDRLMMD